jgi:hypothetical protein
MLALRGPVDDVSSTGLVLLMMIGSIKLQDNLIILMLPKLHQAKQVHGVQILNHLW